MRPAFLSELARRNRHNLRTLRQSPAAEISGALGDFGTLLPLMIALALQGSVDLGATLVFSGLFNIVTGVVFGIPLPVQPMKAIAAAALATHLPLRITTAAGALVSLAILLLSATGLLRLLTRALPVPVIKGIQLGAGLRLVSSGAALILPLAWLRPPLDSRLSTLLAFAVLVLTQRAPRFPYALVVVVLGVVVAVWAGSETVWLGFAPWRPRVRDTPDFAAPDALSAAVSQLPLTALNSVLAVASLAAELFPSFTASSSLFEDGDMPSTPSVTSLGLSVAAMNLAGCWFGAMPVCHGAGGLAAQHRFGARSGASVVLLGLGKLVLGLGFGGYSLPVRRDGSGLRGESGAGFVGVESGRQGLLGLLGRFPKGLLGVMVIAAGLELAKVGAGLNTSGAPDLWEESVAEGGRRCRQLGVREQQERWMVMMVTAAGILAFKNDAVGFMAGCCCHAAYRVADWAERRQTEGRWRFTGERTPLL